MLFGLPKTLPHVAGSYIFGTDATEHERDGFVAFFNVHFDKKGIILELLNIRKQGK